MHFNTRNNDQLLIQHLPVGTNNYGRRAFNYMASTVWNEVPDYIANAPSEMSSRKQLKAHYLGHFSRPPNGRVMSCPEVCLILTLSDIWILTLIQVSGFVNRFWVRVYQTWVWVPEYRVHEIKA